MLLAATIPASCLQYHNPSWSLSLSESPGVFIFPLERELSSLPGRGRSCHPHCDGWLFMTTRSPGPFSPDTSLAPKTVKVTREGAWLESGPHARSMLDSSIFQNIPKLPRLQNGKRHSAPRPPPLTELPPLSGCLSTLARPRWAPQRSVLHRLHVGKVNSTREVGGCPGRGGRCRPISCLQVSLLLPSSPELDKGPS